MNTKYWVAFSSIEELDSIFIHSLFEYFGDIKSAFEAPKNELVKVPDVLKAKVDKFLEKRKNLDIEKTYDEVIKRDIKILTFEDERYPELLKNISNPPMVLYYKGDLFSCNLKKTVAVVGSRRFSYNGRDSLKKVMSGLNRTDMCIVSGLASGADTEAHKLALENHLKTIGVIACGFDYVYPTSNKRLYEEIINGNGAVITEYYPTFMPLKFRFPQRNRIVSGLSYGTLVAEAALHSGALITANLTLEQGRELMCIPGLISNPNTEGIYKLLKTGASIVTNSNDILDCLNWSTPVQKTLFDIKNEENDNFTIDEKKILYTIDIEPKSFDEIQKETGFDVDDLLTILTTLELKGAIEQTLGDRYKQK